MRLKNQRSLARARAEVARLELQEHQFEEALSKRERAKMGRPGALNSDVVLDAAQATEPPMTASEVQQTLAERGIQASVNAVRNHLNRLVVSGDLAKDESKRYFVPDPADFVPQFIPAGADDDVPF